MSATWGLLAAALLDGETGVALAQARVLQGMIDKSGSSPLMQLQQRSWLLHWSLFLAFSDEAGRSFFLDLCFHREGGHGRDRDRGNEYMAALQNNCPWLARYLVVAVFTAPQKTRRSLLKPLVRAVTLVAHEHRDPITDFVAALHEDVDFAAAGDALRHCEPLLRSDFFLSLNAGTAGQFIENARVSVAETFCRVHARVSVSVVAEILGVDAAQASQLLDAALRQSKIDGEVNDEKGQVSVNVRYPTLCVRARQRPPRGPRAPPDPTRRLLQGRRRARAGQGRGAPDRAHEGRHGDRHRVGLGSSGDTECGRGGEGMQVGRVLHLRGERLAPRQSNGRG